MHKSQYAWPWQCKGTQLVCPNSLPAPLLLLQVRLESEQLLISAQPAAGKRLKSRKGKRGGRSTGATTVQSEWMPAMVTTATHDGHSELAITPSLYAATPIACLLVAAAAAAQAPSGHQYYFNTSTGGTTWSKPSSIGRVGVSPVLPQEVWTALLVTRHTAPTHYLTHTHSNRRVSCALPHL